MPRYISVDLPIFASLMIAASAVLSLVAIIAIYREGGILKRLRATPLRPHTILTAHVLVKLLFTALTLAVMVLVGRRYYPVGAGCAARVVHGRAARQHREHPVARFPHRQHRPHRALRAADRDADHVSHARAVGPVRAGRLAAAAAAGDRAGAASTYAVSLLQRHLARRRVVRPRRDVAMLGVLFLVFIAISARVFRWENRLSHQLPAISYQLSARSRGSI